MKTFRHSAKGPDTRKVAHTPGTQQRGMDAFDLEAMRGAAAIKKANATRRVGKALVRGANDTTE